MVIHLRRELRKLLWRTGYDIQVFTPEFNSVARRRQLLKAYAIDVVLDVGANAGQYALGLRGVMGYSKRIVSFEPLKSAFRLLAANAKNDPSWDVLNVALGDTAANQEINVAGNSYSSSLLSMLPLHVEMAPESSYIRKEVVEVKTLDSIFRDVCPTGGSIYLKIDTQGYEGKVIKGAERSLASIDTVQMEMSLVRLYQGELLFNAMYDVMIEKGYSLVGIEGGFTDPVSGQLLQVDGIFHRM
jgi:FkbM family methyltransferase